MKVDINILKEHPLKQEIYRDDDEEQFNILVNRIKESGWLSPVITNKEGTMKIYDFIVDYFLNCVTSAVSLTNISNHEQNINHELSASIRKGIKKTYLPGDKDVFFNKKYKFRLTPEIR